MLKDGLRRHAAHSEISNVISKNYNKLRQYENIVVSPHGKNWMKKIAAFSIRDRITWQALQQLEH